MKFLYFDIGKRFSVAGILVDMHTPGKEHVQPMRRYVHYHEWAAGLHGTCSFAPLGESKGSFYTGV